MEPPLRRLGWWQHAQQQVWQQAQQQADLSWRAHMNGLSLSAARHLGRWPWVAMAWRRLAAPTEVRLRARAEAPRELGAASREDDSDCEGEWRGAPPW